MSFLTELKRRNVLRVAAAYLVAAWLLIQIAETLFPLYGLSDSAIRLVVTLLVIGFVIALVVSWAFELTPEGLMRDKDVDRSESITPQTGKKLDRVIMVVLVLALGYFAFDKFVLDPQRDAEEMQLATEEAVDQAIAEAEEALPDTSIAVLPFENFSGEEADEYFSDGLSDTVLHQLAQVSDLRVIARNSSFQFKGKNLDVRDIGERLGVANVLEGSVQRYGDQVRVIAQLIRTSDGAHVWSQSFDYKMADIFALHDAIATSVVEQMKFSLLPEDRATIRLGGTDMPEAYDLLLQAWGAFWAGISPMVAETVDPDDGFMPMAILDRALALDPDYVDALVAKASMYNMFAFQTSSMSRERQFIDRARPIIARAMELASEYSAVWSIKGAIAHRSGNTNEAIESYARAIELNPNDANAHQGIAVAYGMSDPLKTIEHFRIARELDPENPFDRPLVLALARLGRIDDAISTLESGLKGMSGLDQMRLDDLADITFLALGRPDTSARWSAELLKLQPGSIRGAVGLAGAWLAVGDLERAERWIAGTQRTGGDSMFVKMTKIKLNSARGNTAAAMTVLDSMGPPQGPMAIVVLRQKTKLCIVQNDLDCARIALESFGKAVDMAAARGFSIPEWHRLQHLLSATIAARSGESADVLAQQVVIATRGQPRAGWIGSGIYYEDAEAFVLLGKQELALQALEEALLPDGGFLPRDSFLTPADRGVVLSGLDGVPGFEDWKTRFRARREAMRETMLTMEAAGEIPVPPEAD
jgi:TolB-like protein/tetratricopeptide (TPR) repeat protein